MEGYDVVKQLEAINAPNVLTLRDVNEMLFDFTPPFKNILKPSERELLNG
jgi:hypothetical protein